MFHQVIEICFEKRCISLARFIPSEQLEYSSFLTASILSESLWRIISYWTAGIFFLSCCFLSESLWRIIAFWTAGIFFLLLLPFRILVTNYFLLNSWNILPFLLLLWKHSCQKHSLTLSPKIFVGCFYFFFLRLRWSTLKNVAQEICM